MIFSNFNFLCFPTDANFALPNSPLKLVLAVVDGAVVVVVVKVEDSTLELFVGDPQADVPGHKPCK